MRWSNISPMKRTSTALPRMPATVGMELPVKHDGRLGRVAHVVHPAQHIVQQIEIGRPNLESGFRGDRAFDEFPRPQQFERAFIRFCRASISARGGAVT